MPVSIDQTTMPTGSKIGSSGSPRLTASTRRREQQVVGVKQQLAAGDAAEPQRERGRRVQRRSPASLAPRGDRECLAPEPADEQRRADQAGELEREDPVGQRLGRIAGKQAEARDAAIAAPSHMNGMNPVNRSSARRGDAEHPERNRHPAADEERHSPRVQISSTK
jgi:hypothetical protein